MKKFFAHCYTNIAYKKILLAKNYFKTYSYYNKFYNIC